MKNNTPFFTIIIPIYNAERFLSKAIDSLLNQTFKDFQLLLIDDCSTDNSFNICRSLSKKDYRIEVYQTKENSGAAAARNYGLERAQG
ncbi:glycosyltransferase family 2 protein, partial [Veillonella magna]|uniref:glycosyltransferase family 2 protein n=1 Tax=Veillonella magna TaxID=464322 RepID=UPI002665AE84